MLHRKQYRLQRRGLPSAQGLRQLLDAPQMLRAQREALDGVAFDAAAARRKFSELINGYEEDTT